MIFLRFFLSLVTPCFIGWTAVTLLPRRSASFSNIEKASLSFGLGWGILTLEMFYASLLKLPWSPFLLLLPWFVPFLFSLRKREKKIGGIPSDQKIPLNSLERNLLLFLLFLFLYTVIEGLTFPLTHYDLWDAWSIWGQKAKAFALRRSVDLSFFTDPSRFYAHQEYPLLLPLSESWIYLTLGKIDEQTVKLLFPLFTLSFLVLFWGSFRREKSRQTSLLLVTLLATLPILLEYTLRAYAEIPLTLYYTLSTLYLYFWCKEGKGTDLWIGVLFSAFSAWTKNEGGALFAVNAVIFGATRFLTSSSPVRRKILEGGILLLPLLLLLPWWLFLKKLGISSSEFFPQLKGAVLSTNFSRLPIVLKTFFWKLLDIQRWNFLWVGFFLFGAVSWRELFSFPKASLTVALLCHLLLYLFIYVIHPLDVLWAMNVDDSFNRILLHAAPLAFFLLGSSLENLDTFLKAVYTGTRT
ncbi:MAG: glycosyltransferase family 39 protein [Candidatus Omnitrophica bacterium]|nr:glycosyltransferase family 39 protein [Candidatus Omnitrophota bacterium]